MTKFIIVRHGQSIGNLKEVFLGHTDMDLTPTGKLQAQATADYLKDTKIDVIYSSDLCRAYNTAVPIAKSHNLPIIKDKRLREIYAGKWEGCSQSYINEQFHDDYYTWRKDIANSRCTEGESAKELFTRVSEALDEYAVKHDGKTVCVATHATPLRLLKTKWLGLPLTDAKKLLWVANASVTIVYYDNGKYNLEVFGENSFMGDLITDIPGFR